MFVRILAVMFNTRVLPLFAAAVLLLAAAPASNDLHTGSAQIFAPGVISGPASDGSPTFSPDGNTLLFTRSGSGAGMILESHFVDGAWTTPTIASFSGEWNDQHPSFAPDGTYVVFVSTRPAPNAPKRHAHIWKVERTETGWGTPQHLPATVNFAPWIFAPSVAADGTLYYLDITRTGTQRAFQLYRSRVKNGAYQPAEKLSFSSPKTADVDPEIAPDQSFLVFASSGRRAGDTNEHLYITKRDGNGWSTPQALRYDGDDENGSSNDNEPRISRDARTLYFASDRSSKGHNGNTNVWSVKLPQI